jgi:hypothetical protein
LDSNNTLNVSRATLGGVQGLAVLRGHNNTLTSSRAVSGASNPLRTNRVQLSLGEFWCAGPR